MSSRLPGTAAAVVLALALSAAASAAQEGAVPDPPTAGMETPVAEAIAARRLAVASAPESASAWGDLGRVLHAHGLEMEAAASYRRATTLDPADFRWPYLRAAALRHLRPRAALAAAGRAIELEPGYAPAHLLAAELLERAAEAGPALEAWRAALAAAPDSALAELGVGRMLLAAGEIEAAAPRLERAAALAPRARPVQAELARLRRQQGRPEAARRLAAAAGDLPADVPVEDPLLVEVWDTAVSVRGIEQRALRAEGEGDFEGAELLYERLAEQNPTAPDVHFNHGNFLVRSGRLEDAVARFEAALRIAPDHVPARVNLGSALLLLGRRHDAARQLEAALERDPGDPDAHRTLAGLRAYRGENERAIRHFRAVLDHDPAAAEVHRDLAIVLAAEGHFESAWEHVARAEALGAPPPSGFLLRLQAAHPRPGR